MQDLANIERDLETSIWRDHLPTFAYSSPAYELVTGTKLRQNLAVDCQLAVWQAFVTGQISDRVILEIGPGTSKSTLKVVADAWQIARAHDHRMLRGSHSFELAGRDSRRTRRIVESDWFRARFGVRLRDDENTMSYWSTTRGGFYIAVGAGSGVIGHRVRDIVVDDGLTTTDAHSKAAREAAYTWLTEGLLTRLDSIGGYDGRVLVIGQRLGRADLAGRLRETGAWTVVTVPAEYDPRRRCFVIARDGAELWSDSRTEPGELLAPDVLGREKLDELRASIGSAAYQAQYNQAPASDDTSMCPPRWWKFYRQPHTADGQRRPVGCDDSPAADLPDHFERKVIACDLTFGATGASADYAVIACWARLGGAYYLLEMFRRRCGFEEQLEAIKAMSERHSEAKVICELAANGRAIVETLQKHIPAPVFGVKPLGPKTARIAATVPIIESGAAHLPEGAAWTADVVDEYATYPGVHDDIPDACAYALADLQNVAYDGGASCPPISFNRVTGAVTGSASGFELAAGPQPYVYDPSTDTKSPL